MQDIEKEKDNTKSRTDYVKNNVWSYELDLYASVCCPVFITFVLKIRVLYTKILIKWAGRLTGINYHIFRATY